MPKEFTRKTFPIFHKPLSEASYRVSNVSRSILNGIVPESEYFSIETQAQVCLVLPGNWWKVYAAGSQRCAV